MLFSSVISTLEDLGTALRIHVRGGIENVGRSFGPRSAAALGDGLEQRVSQVKADAEVFVDRLDAVIQQRRLGRLQNDTKQELGQAAEATGIGAAEVAALLRELVPQAEVTTGFDLDTEDLLERVEFDDVTEIEQALLSAKRSLAQLHAAHVTLCAAPD